MAKRLANSYANFLSSEVFRFFPAFAKEIRETLQNRKLFYCKFFIRYFCRKRKTRRKVFDIKNAINLNENFQQILQAKVVHVQCWLVRSLYHITCSSQQLFSGFRLCLLFKICQDERNKYFILWSFEVFRFCEFSSYFTVFSFF